MALTASKDLLDLCKKGQEDDKIKQLLNGSWFVDVNNENADGNSPLHWAAYHGMHGIVQLLVSKGATVDKFNRLGSTPLMIASRYGKTKVVRALIAQKANVNTMSGGEAVGQKKNALTIAVSVGNLEVSRILIDAKAKIQPDCLLHTCFDEKKRNGEMRDLLLEKKADVNGTGNCGHTALMTAVIFKNDAAVECLVKVDAIDLDKQNDKLWSALHFAYAGRNQHAIDLLIKYGADSGIKNEDGQLPEELGGDESSYEQDTLPERGRKRPSTSSSVILGLPGGRSRDNSPPGGGFRRTASHAFDEDLTQQRPTKRRRTDILADEEEDDGPFAVP